MRKRRGPPAPERGGWRGNCCRRRAGFWRVEVVLLVPALLVAEATISYLGLGFSDAQASWGTMMQDAANGRVLAEAPWMLAPAAGVFLVVLGAQLI